ncbi:aldose epimerase family protein [Lyngbya aestuarii]|uniref:aldose epimerase family protein n=1 Tax=Lyngbya aestuarii TaxID=118322 RepID=UPI00403D6146
MFEITTSQKQYQTYTLTDQEAKSQLEIVPERGGIVTQWSFQGQEILYLDNERFADPSLTVRGGIPILFPICGNLPDNTYTYQGKEFQLKQHGFARNLPWRVTEQLTNERASLTLVLNSNDQTRAVYPFDFQVSFTYQLKGDTLEIQQRYTNYSEEPMPFSTGLHPYFLISDKDQLELDIPASEYQNQNSQVVHSFDGGFDLSTDEIDAAFLEPNDNCASAIDKERRIKITLSYTELYSTLVFWTVKGKDFYCLEPWSAPRNALNTGEKITRLSPGESLEASVSLKAMLF